MDLPENFWFNLSSTLSKEFMDKYMDGTGLPIENLTKKRDFRVYTSAYDFYGGTRYKVEIYNTSANSIEIGVMTTFDREQAIAAHYNSLEALSNF